MSDLSSPIALGEGNSVDRAGSTESGSSAESSTGGGSTGGLRRTTHSSSSLAATLSPISSMCDIDEMGSLSTAIEPGGTWGATLVEAKEVKDGLKPFIVYVIRVNHTSASGDRFEWECTRRYSEFDDLHARLKKEHAHEVAESGLAMPTKKLFGNMTKDFVRNRGQKLMVWLATLTSKEFLSLNTEIEPKMKNFLMEGAYKMTGGLANKFANTFKPGRNRTSSESSLGADADQPSIDANVDELMRKRDSVASLLCLLHTGACLPPRAHARACLGCHFALNVCPPAFLR